MPNMQSLRPYRRWNEIQIRKDKTEKSANHDKEIHNEQYNPIDPSHRLLSLNDLLTRSRHVM